MPATPVGQLTSYTCSLACLESYFADINAPLRQAEMLEKHLNFLENPDPARNHEYGALDDAKIVGFCSHLGYKAGLYQEFRQPVVEKAFADALAATQGVLILANWQKQSQHCVRLSQIKNSGIYEVMCPQFHRALMLDVTLPDLISWGFRFIVVSK